ncbi:hypothetical protein DL96DRAFT_1559946 [Flagelloscypha sp. PMI_526]|nr:hypothetical protein DL96DRAFT_1559946 [Flagelloscypha sp. PMI_526]
MSAPADPAALTSTPLAGASQGQDVEATINTPLLPSVSQPRLGSRIPLRKIGRISVFVGICVVVLAACCLIFFTSVAIGRSILLRRNKGAHPGNPRSDAQDEYISSILAGGFFPVIMAALFPVFAALDSRILPVNMWALPALH